MLKEYLSTLANKFREILGETDKINAQDFAVKIDEVFNEGYLQGFPYGYNRGKEEGKLELLRDSEYMNAQVSGTAIAVNDVSPIEHSVGCYLTSDTITDFSGIEVSRYGKNLLPTEFSTVNDANWGEKVDDERRFYFENLKVGHTYTLSFKKIKELTNYGFFRLYKYDGTKTQVGTFAWGGGLVSTQIPFTVEDGYDYYIYALFTGAQGMLDDAKRFVALGDFQLELGNVATDYEPYIEPTTYQVEEDGTVEGIKSIAPNMTLLTNNTDVVINANYLRDIDTYIDNLITDVALTGGE